MKTLKLTLVLTLILLPSSRAQEARFFRVAGPVESSITAFSADGYITWTNELTNATFTVQTAQTLVGPSNWVDYIQVPVTNAATTHRLYDPNPPTNMMLIPAGRFTMGNCINPGEGSGDELPLHSVYVSAFYMDQAQVTNDKMVEVMQWAYQTGKVSVTSATVKNLEGNQQELLDLNYSACRITWNGSEFEMKAAKGSGYPCVAVTWYGAIAFCNYRSQMEGRTPCYNLTNWSCNWAANGYRLPTEAEWEKAARGGVTGHRFPWSDTDTISHNRANYSADPFFLFYDVNPTPGYHPAFVTSDGPCTNPAGYFSANGYGLYDMAGNVEELCWDWYQSDWYSQPSATQDNPRGPTGPLTYRVRRGGSWWWDASLLRCANRVTHALDIVSHRIGFRCVRGL